MRNATRDKWLGWLAEHAASSMTVAKFCKKKGVSQNSFYNWQRKLPTLAAEPETFVPVSVVAPNTLEIELPGGAIMRIPSDDRALRGVLELLCEIGARR
jgi:hypothetical protein